MQLESLVRVLEQDATGLSAMASEDAGRIISALMNDATVQAATIPPVNIITRRVRLFIQPQLHPTVKPYWKSRREASPPGLLSKRSMPLNPMKKSSTISHEMRASMLTR